MSLVSVVCCQVEVSASGRSLVQRIPTEYGVFRAVITRSYLTGYSPAIQSPASVPAASRLAMPIARTNEEAEQSTNSASLHHSTSQR